MHCKINRQYFLQKLRFMATVAQMGKRDDVLSNGIIFSLRPDEITLMASNGQTDLRMVIRENFEFITEGRVVLPAKTIVDLMNKIDGEFVEWMVTNYDLEIKAISYKCVLKTIDAEQMPAVNWDWEQEHPVTMERDVVRMAIKKVGGTVDSGSEQTKTLRTILFDASDGQLTVLATDSVRLSVLRLPWEQQRLFVWIEPNILRLVADLSGPTFDMSHDQSSVFFSGGNWFLKYQMFEGEYPNVSRVFQLDVPNQFTFHRQDLLLALDRGIQLGSEATTPVKCIIKKKVLELQFLTQAGQSQDVIGINGSAEERMLFNLNATNLLRLLRNFQGGDLVWKYKDPSRPVFLSDPSEPEFLQIIFPLRNFQ